MGLLLILLFQAAAFAVILRVPRAPRPLAAYLYSASRLRLLRRSLVDLRRVCTHARRSSIGQKREPWIAWRRIPTSAQSSNSSNTPLGGRPTTARPPAVSSSGTCSKSGRDWGRRLAFSATARQRSWTCLEPDPDLHRQLESSLDVNPLASPGQALLGTVASLPMEERLRHHPLRRRPRTHRGRPRGARRISGSHCAPEDTSWC